MARKYQKYTVKYNGRKFNATFGDDAYEVKFIVENEPFLNRCNGRVVSMLEQNGYATIFNQGPGWGLEISVNREKMIADGLIKSADYNVRRY